MALPPPLAHEREPKGDGHQARYGNQPLRVNGGENETGHRGTEHDAPEITEPAAGLAQVAVEHAPEHGLFHNGSKQTGQQEHLKPAPPAALGNFADYGMAREIGRSDIVGGVAASLDTVLQQHKH